MINLATLKLPIYVKLLEENMVIIFLIILFAVGSYQIYYVEVCPSDKEAAKMFGLYINHKFSLPKLEQCGKGMQVSVLNEKIDCTYELWRAREKIHVEAVYFKMVSSSILHNLFMPLNLL